MVYHVNYSQIHGERRPTWDELPKAPDVWLRDIRSTLFPRYIHSDVISIISWISVDCVQLVPNELEVRLRNVKVDETSKTSHKKTDDQAAPGNLFDPSWTQYNTQRRSPLPPVKAKPSVSFSFFNISSLKVKYL